MNKDDFSLTKNLSDVPNTDLINENTAIKRIQQRPKKNEHLTAFPESGRCDEVNLRHDGVINNPF